MKTIKEHLNELPDDCRKMAIDNYKKYEKLGIIYPQNDTLCDAIMDVFDFHASPQGFDFWYNIMRLNENR